MRILVAEDDKVFQALVREILTEAGYDVVIKENGQEAWDFLKSDGADLAVFDVNMPLVTGFELLRKVRADEALKTMPVIIFTVKALNEDQVLGYDSGADDYIAKPFDADLFLAKVRALARRAAK